jgi:hypothetical protein
LRSDISVSDGMVRGSARASTAQNAMTNTGHRATNPPIRPKMAELPVTESTWRRTAQATLRQWPLTATRSNTDLNASR